MLAAVGVPFYNRWNLGGGDGQTWGKPSRVNLSP
jgi:hypothetical protein